MKLILAVTAASGAVYARQTAERLAALDCVESVALVYSDVAPTVMAHEGVALPDHPKFVRYDNRDLFAPPASGSARYDAMIVVPCSVGTAGRIASGVSQTLIERAADVMLKERRRLILVVRETPLSLIHLRNLTVLAECGAVVLPAAPSSNRSAPRSPNASSRSSAPKPSITNGGRSLRPQTAGIGRSHTNRRSEPSSRAADTEPSGSSGGCLRSRTHAPSAGNFRPGILYFRFFL